LTALYIVLGIILLALGIIFFSNVKFEIEAFADQKSYFLHFALRHLVVLVESDKGGEHPARIMTISVFGIRLPFKFKYFDKAKEKAEKNIDLPEKDAETTAFEAFKASVDIFFDIRDDIFKTLSYFADKLVFNKLFITIQVGFEDAAYTALSTGLCYTVLSPVLGFLFNTFRVKETNTDVKACYNESVLSGKTDIQLSIRPYCLIVLACKAISVVSKIQKQYKKYTKGEIENE